MPNFDRTGPRGMGPVTGRGMGPCGRGLGFRKGYGRGLGRGYGWRYYETPVRNVELTKEEEKKILEAELKEIETEKNEIKKRLEELK